MQLRSIYIRHGVIQQRSFAKEQHFFRGRELGAEGRVKAKTLDIDDRAFYVVSILSIVDSLLLINPRVRREDLLCAQEDHFLAFGSSADAADE